MILLCNDAIALTRAEFLALPNYSSTLPTGATPGKAWRRAGFYYEQEISDVWWRGVYGKPYPEGQRHGQIPIGWRRIVVLGVPARFPRDIEVPARPMRGRMVPA